MKELPDMKTYRVALLQKKMYYLGSSSSCSLSPATVLRNIHFKCLSYIFFTIDLKWQMKLKVLKLVKNFKH